MNAKKKMNLYYGLSALLMFFNVFVSAGALNFIFVASALFFLFQGIKHYDLHKKSQGDLEQRSSKKDNLVGWLILAGVVGFMIYLAYYLKLI